MVIHELKLRNGQWQMGTGQLQQKTTFQSPPFVGLSNRIKKESLLMIMRTNFKPFHVKKRGGYKLLSEEVDEKVIKLVKEMQSSGAAMSYNILIGIAKGVVTANDCTLLKENDGKIEFSMTWAQSFFKRIGFVKRKATTAKVPIAPGFVKEIGI